MHSGVQCRGNEIGHAEQYIYMRFSLRQATSICKSIPPWILTTQAVSWSRVCTDASSQMHKYNPARSMLTTMRLQFSCAEDNRTFSGHILSKDRCETCLSFPTPPIILSPCAVMMEAATSDFAREWQGWVTDDDSTHPPRSTGKGRN